MNRQIYCNFILTKIDIFEDLYECNIDGYKFPIAKGKYLTLADAIVSYLYENSMIVGHILSKLKDTSYQFYINDIDIDCSRFTKFFELTEGFVSEYIN